MVNLCNNCSSYLTVIMGVKWCAEWCDIMHCGGFLILHHVISEKQKAFTKLLLQWEKSLEEILETDMLTCRGESEKERQGRRQTKTSKCTSISTDINRNWSYALHFSGIYKKAHKATIWEQKQRCQPFSSETRWIYAYLLLSVRGTASRCYAKNGFPHNSILSKSIDTLQPFVNTHLCVRASQHMNVILDKNHWSC